MLLSTDNFLVDKVKARIYKNRKLATAIKTLNLARLEPYGYRLEIESTETGASEINQKLVWILRVAVSLAPVLEVKFDDDILSLRALAIISPSIKKPADGEHDRRLRMNQQQQRSLLFDTAIEALATDYNVFLISSNGRYEDVRFHVGTESLIPAEAMIGKYLHEVIGTSAAEIILGCIQAAQKSGTAQKCCYDIIFASGERRWYSGTIYPSQDNQPLLLTVKRVK